MNGQEVIPCRFHPTTLRFDCFIRLRYVYMLVTPQILSTQTTKSTHMSWHKA